MDELQKNLEEIKENIERLKSITDALVSQKNILDRLSKFDRIEKEVMK